ncbi:hypothetical protein Bccel_0792 [Pseudobacteroides cellulosolvens ATCC 35603 = DSM 2933]|uniref:Uncharacterized protein n=1 Tax=Pseudobacteroides cellulosolvens ATCC 35603 = DSM 2933 TaxID=398512 RepID=A0A0L6JJD3_9FIRM|nr:hypothetical protein [Pseudobacteroides cellulosolvens]KNY25532.1 hypothetical protein Bccel_0792 [Pseudobacteroides cellulosolvens ATCC 35603 = DSM 2933]
MSLNGLPFASVSDTFKIYPHDKVGPIGPKKGFVHVITVVILSAVTLPPADTTKCTSIITINANPFLSLYVATVPQ